MKLVLWEIWSYVQVPIIWFLFKKLAKRNVAGDIIAGCIIGMFLEFATEPLWDYHFRFTFYKDIPPGVVLGWGVMFTLVTYFSEKAYCKLFKLPDIISHDKRIFLFDVVMAALIAFPMETIGLKSGVWDYRYDRLGWDWGVVPFFEMPYEALMGYALLMLIAPTFVRYWQSTFES